MRNVCLRRNIRLLRLEEFRIRCGFQSRFIRFLHRPSGCFQILLRRTISKHGPVHAEIFIDLCVQVLHSIVHKNLSVHVNLDIHKLRKLSYRIIITYFYPVTFLNTVIRWFQLPIYQYKSRTGHHDMIHLEGNGRRCIFFQTLNRINCISRPLVIG